LNSKESNVWLQIQVLHNLRNEKKNPDCCKIFTTQQQYHNRKEKKLQFIINYGDIGKNRRKKTQKEMLVF
jgi:hypothetical protein